MRYKNSTISLSKMVLGQRGSIAPLCNSCKTKDCSHFVEEHKVSVFGVAKKFRLMHKSGQPVCVISCEGYSK